MVINNSIAHGQSSCFLFFRVVIGVEQTADAMTHLEKFGCRDQPLASIYCMEKDVQTWPDNSTTSQPTLQKIEDSEKKRAKLPRVITFLNWICVAEIRGRKYKTRTKGQKLR